MKPSPMTTEVSEMLTLRHSAEQRGEYEPLGRLVNLITEHGPIEFPCEQGMGVGPDLATLRQIEIANAPNSNFYTETHVFIILGAWAGLPALWERSDKPCPKCRHACDVCDGSGKKLCEGNGCGGRGWIAGNWISCPGPGCHKDTGKFKPGCATCADSEIKGQIREELSCPMCGRTGKMTCSRCRGTGKFSTGMISGSLDYRLPKCKACHGTSWKGKFREQKLEQYTNARLCDEKKKEFLVLGPIYNFTVMPFGGGRGTFRMFDVIPDGKNDLLNLLVPAAKRMRPQKAYLVGGVVRERMEGAA